MKEQIRLWFYSMLVMGVALTGKTPYKKVSTYGSLLAQDGKKLSKSSKNYTDPMELMKSFGTDAFRLYMYYATYIQGCANPICSF